MRSLVLAAMMACASSVAFADTIYPLDRATILAGSPFDFKIEFDGTVKAEDVKILVNGEDYKSVFGKDFTFVDKDGDVEASAVTIRDAVLSKSGAYKIEASAGDQTKTVTWDVYKTDGAPKAKNVIFLIGDGLSVAHRTAARLMAKGMTEGKANGHLNMDSLDRMAFIGTSSTGSIATDSANTASAYMTGHKSAINAIGVYGDRTKDSLDDPRVENITEALRRTGNRAVGIVTTSELQDATPASVLAHTRKRADKAIIAEQMMALKPEVVLGGGSAYYLPQATPGSKRKDDKDLIAQAKTDGYTLATTVTELEQAAAEAAAADGKLLGLFHTGNLDTALDRTQLKKGSVSKFPEQPGLEVMTKSALDVLSKKPEGFFLMVEAANIDKQSHPLDWERAVFDTIEFDRVVGMAIEFQKNNPDTLIVVTGDHTHGVSLVGTFNREDPTLVGREKLAVYADAGFPNYKDENGDGYPDSVDVSRPLALFSSNFPDYYETFGPKLDNPFIPAVQNEKKEYVANEAYKDVPGAVLRTGNLPLDNDTGVHAVDDVVLQATGPGSEQFKGYMEQSDVYRVVADVFALGANR